MTDITLITGAAGFIGYHTCLTLLKRGKEVVGIDNLNDYYDPLLKQNRLNQLLKFKNFTFEKLNVVDRNEVDAMFSKYKPKRVIHLAAQAGVRYSIEKPYEYIDNNIGGFATILEGCRHHQTKHLIYASSSSVYGLNSQMPFSVNHNVDHPISLYAASKKSNELMAHSYSHLYQLATTGLRFFTVYGPWGRPDMALFLFTKAILEGKPIQVFNRGEMRRDFTYIDDVVEGIIRLMDAPPTANTAPNANKNPSSSSAPYEIFNIGNHTPIKLNDFISCIEKSVGKKAEKVLLPMQPGDVNATAADVGSLIEKTGFEPSTSYAEGIDRFVRWYRDYYNS